LAKGNFAGDDVADLLGVDIDRSVAYRILKQTSNLTAEHIRRLAERFAISADALLAR
jgi:antitoxin component HigA of HigAB toxin-antitoxin module